VGQAAAGQQTRHADEVQAWETVAVEQARQGPAVAEYEGRAAAAVSG